MLVPSNSHAVRDINLLMAKKSTAGILLYRRCEELEVFLVHPGGPFWAKKDLGAWSLPKGEIGEGEDPLEAAKREFTEETGFPIAGEFHPLAPVKQTGGKRVYAWAVEGDCDPAQVRSNLFSMAWPPKSGKTQEFPEVDRAAWFSIAEARKRILAPQAGFLDQLLALSRNAKTPEPSPLLGETKP
jgi:predicted NUDIX family NTP pyrophosphohydrolase